MPVLRTKSISTKVTDEEYSQFEALAGEQTISEWARNVLLNAAKLNPREQAIIRERRLKEEPATLEDLSKTYNISRERVRQIESRAMEKLQKEMTEGEAA